MALQLHSIVDQKLLLGIAASQLLNCVGLQKHLIGYLRQDSFGLVLFGFDHPHDILHVSSAGVDNIMHIRKKKEENKTQ